MKRRLVLLLLLAAASAQTKLDYLAHVKNGPVVSVQGSDGSGSASTTPVNSSISFAVVASTTYTLECDLIYTESTTATNGLRLYVTGPAGATWVQLGAVIWTTAGAHTWYPVTAFGSAMGASTATTVTTVQPARITGAFAIGSTAGTVQIQYSNNGTTGSTVLKRASWCRLQ